MMNPQKQKVIKLDQIRKQMDEIKAKSKKEYSPKWGRQLAKLEKEYIKVA